MTGNGRPRRKDSSYFSGICSHFETNKRNKEYVAHQAKVRETRRSFNVYFHCHVVVLQVHSVGWSCDGSRLASGSFDKTVTIWSLESDRLGRDGNYKVHTGSVDQLRWHPLKPEVLVTASGDKTVRVWDARGSL